MRVSPVALLAQSEAEVLSLAHHATAATHDHPEGIKGAQATALAIWLARQGESATCIRQKISERFGCDLDTTVDALRPTYRHSEAARCQKKDNPGRSREPNGVITSL